MKQRLRRLLSPLAVSQSTGLAALTVATAVFIALMALLGNSAQLFFWTTVADTVLFAMAVNLLFGQTGMLSFGQAAYFGMGAYAVGLLSEHHQGPLVMLLVATGVGAGASIVVGAATLRTSDLVFAMLTLAVGMCLYSLTFHLQTLGGENGLVGIFPGRLAGIDLTDPRSLWIFTACVTVLVVAFLWVLSHSPFGRTLKMIRDDPQRAECLGISVFRYKLAAFVVSGGLCGLGGALYAWVQSLATPDVLFWTTSGVPVIVSLLGGAGVFFGPVVGAGIYTWAVDRLSDLTSAWVFWVGLGFLAVVMLAPEGILGGLERLRKRVWQPEPQNVTATQEPAKPEAVRQAS
jgi:branched-chain amino acid transport system permease protein